MTSESKPEVFLEVTGAPAEPSAPRQEGVAEGAWLEVEGDASGASPEGASPRRKKVRAADRGGSQGDAVSVAIVTALQTERPLMAALWPDVPSGDLLRSPPPAEAFAARCDFAVRAIDAVARRDSAARARAEVAQRALEQHLARLTSAGPTARDAALSELVRAQTDDLLAAVAVMAGAGRVLYASDAAKLAAAAEGRGLDPVRAREAVERAGYQVLATEAREWAPLEALPGAPATMDTAAVALLQQPAQAAEAIRAGTVLAWLRANGAAAEVIERARNARLVCERPGGELLAVHTQAWALGRRDLVVGGAWLASPGDLPGGVRTGRVSLEDLRRSAREGVLGAWLRMHGWTAAAGAADLVAQGEPTGMKRLAWALGEAVVLEGVGFSDPAAMARAVMARPELREALVGLYASGDLLGWLESLPPALRDEQWIDRLRRARQHASDDQLSLWTGIYAYARAHALVLKGEGGHAVTFSSVEQLKITAQLTDVWDDLKRAYRTGELLAWLGRVAPEADLTALPRPPRDEDTELNALLWDLGHAGLVLEWGQRDFAVTSPGDLVRAYQARWQQLEAQLARGYVLSWLERFHGARVVGEVALRDLSGALRREVGQLPAGFAALKLALLCGLRYLPLDPCQPGDQATYRGWSGATADRAGEPSAWEPLRDHVVQGTALLWLALQPSTRPQLSGSLLRGAFRGGGPSDPGRLLAGVASAFGVPVPSPVLQAELERALGRPSVVAAPPVAGQALPVATLPVATLPSAPPVVVVPPLAPTRALSKRRGVTAWLAFAGALLALLGGTLAWLQFGSTPPSLDPLPPTGREAWVRLEVKVRADADHDGIVWDLDRTPPDLRVQVQTHDGVAFVGPCADRLQCEDTVGPLRLSPDTPFRVAIADRDALSDESIGWTWLVWDGASVQALSSRVGACALEVRVRTLTPSPPLAPPSTPSTRPAIAPSETPHIPARRRTTTPRRTSGGGKSGGL